MKKHHKEYRTWLRIIAKCHDPLHERYPWYGARGIKVSPDWRDSFDRFLGDMGPAPTAAHTIERERNDGDYEAANCRWATWKEQAQNRRTSVFLELGGRKKTMAQWADELGVDRRVIWKRLKMGWDLARALTERPAHGGRNAA